MVTCRYCASQVMVRELQDAAINAIARENTALPEYASGADNFTSFDLLEDIRPPRLDPSLGLEQAARLARSGDRQAAIKLYRESQDSSRQEAQQVVQLLQEDLEIQPDWAAERVRRQLESSRAPEVGKRQPNRGNWVVYGMLILLALALLIPLLVVLFSG